MKNNNTIIALLLFVCLLSFYINAQPLVKAPRFGQLSTENGLSQDFINDVLLDNDGFLWIATGTGLNRYDGYFNKRYVGLSNEFADDGIYSLFQDQNNDLWVSTYSSGVYRVDGETGESKRELAIKYKNQPAWYQYVSHFISGPGNIVYIAFDHMIVEFNLDTGTWKSIFDLQLPKLGLSEDTIIRNIKLQGDVLFIATSQGLYTYHFPTQATKAIQYVADTETNKDKLNAKLIITDSAGQLWLGTVEGLFKFSIDDVVTYASTDSTMLPQATQVIPSLNIWAMLSYSGNEYYLATNDGLYLFDVSTEKINHLFKPSDSNLLITDNNITDIIATPTGQLWLSTNSSGVLLWNPKSVAFTNIFADKISPEQLSENTVNDLHVQDEQNLWVGTNNGLNLYNLKSGKIEQFLVTDDRKAVASSSSVFIIREGEDDWVWLVTYEGLVKFDLKQKKAIPLPLSSQSNSVLGSDKAYDILRLFDNNYLVAAEDGFYRLDNARNILLQDETLSSSLNPEQFYTFLPDYSSSQESVLISMTGALWRYSFNTRSLTKIHEARNVQGEYVIQPTDAVIDDHGILWISYPGHGLYGIDENTYEQQYFFDSSNLLPTNIIFSLIKDKDDNLWMASHMGLLKLNASTLALTQYTTKEGLITNEFSWGARKKLINDNLVFGSQKGFTLFDPRDFTNDADNSTTVLITDARLISREIPLGIGRKNDKDIALQYDDIGLTINYSDMRYDPTNSGYFKYTLAGSVDIDYPPSKLTEVTFPRLEPGQYTFSVSMFDKATNTAGPSSVLRISVAYPPFASPFAYTVYVLLAIALIAVIFKRRKSHRNRLKAAHLDVLKNKNRLSMALTASNTKVWDWREETNLITQDRIESELGYPTPSDKLTFEEHCQLIHKHDLHAFEMLWQGVLLGEIKHIDITYRLKAQNGQFEWYRDVGALVSDDTGNEGKRLTGTYSNITESIDTQTKAQLFGEAFEHTRDWVVIFDNQLKPIIANQSVKEALHISANKDISEQLSKVFFQQKATLKVLLNKMRDLPPNGHWNGEAEIESLMGRKYVVNAGVTAVCSANDSNEISRYLVIFSDITQQKDAQAALVQLANYDSLTGLPNRSLLLDRIQHAFDQALIDKTSLCLFFIDLDRFKQINDSLGHDAGDILLKVIGKRLEKILRQSDTVARLGGDEFVVMIEKVEAEEDINRLASKMIRELAKSVSLANQIVSVSASIGISLYPEDASTPAELLKNADIAMYYAKELGSNNFQYFTKHMNEKAQTRLQLENAIKQAYLNDLFTGFYQPVVHAKDGAISGFELLMRWPNENGMTPPDVFIPVAESIGFIEDMTIQVLEKAIPLLSGARWQQHALYLSINLSALHISKPAKIDEIIALLKRHNISTNAIRFEITESSLMSNYEEAMKAVSIIKKHGFIIALDDFGTGYSSLRYLKDFPIDVLKIDKSFVDDVGTNQGNEGIVLAILRMAESLKIACIAEGIETQQQVDFFNAHGCKYLQGFFYSKPVDADSLTTMLSHSPKL
ncbi:EAL domain-containing protein [Alteromonas sp. A079]|uniref:EAL domain-containing protein n=1 Tax=Alteromonas sp. A079 TaxID=3410268 RepID=UPI003BA18A79